MRVIAGSARGVPLKGPPGGAARRAMGARAGTAGAAPTRAALAAGQSGRLDTPAPVTRPTSDKVRGAIFDALVLHLDGARVLDLYAGTGALGIEALSRGAAACLFVERAPAVCRVIAANLTATRLAAQGLVWCMSVAAALERLAQPSSRARGGGYARPGEEGEGFSSTFGPPYDVIVLDPPYRDPAIATVMARVGCSTLVARGGVVVLEHDKRWQPPTRCGALRLYRTRLYGDTGVTLWQHEEAAED